MLHLNRESTSSDDDDDAQQLYPAWKMSVFNGLQLGPTYCTCLGTLKRLLTVQSVSANISLMTRSASLNAVMYSTRTAYSSRVLYFVARGHDLWSFQVVPEV